MSSCFPARLSIVLALIALLQPAVYGQGSAGSAALFESRAIVDMPTAGVISTSNYAFAARMAPNGNFTADMAVSPFKNMNIRLFATGKHLISNLPVEINLPTLQVQFRVLDETRTFPALALGISSKTNGYFSHDFVFNQSVGGWLTVSKNFRGFLGAIALHGGIFGSEHSLGSYGGFEQSLGSSLAIVGEATLVSKKDNLTKQNKIYGVCNASFRWSVVRGITLEIIAHDLFSSVGNPGIGRAFGVEFIRVW